MAFREPFRTPLGAFVRTSFGARTRGASPFPLNTPQWLDGYLTDDDEVTNSPHGMPNCNAGDPQNPERATQLRPRTGYGVTAANYIVFSMPVTDDIGHVLVDLARLHTEAASFGVPWVIGNACIALGPWVAKADLPGPVIPQDTVGGYDGALLIRGDGNLDWQFVAGEGTGIPPGDEEFYDRYLVSSLATSGESPQSQVFNVPAGLVSEGTIIAYARCNTLHSPRMWLTNPVNSPPALVRVLADPAAYRWAWGYRMGSNLPSPGTSSTATINAVGFGTPHTLGTPIVPETASLTINWT